MPTSYIAEKIHNLKQMIYTSFSLVESASVVKQHQPKGKIFKPVGTVCTPGYIMMKNRTLHFVTHASWRIRTKYQYYLDNTMLLLQRNSRIEKSIVQ